MTEYDYSPEAVQQYLNSQTRIQQWTAATARSNPIDPSTPPTPALRPSVGLPPIHSSSTQSAWAHKKQDAMRKMHAYASAAPPNLTVQMPAAAGNQVYAYAQQTTPYGSQLSITQQTSDGRCVQQQSYRETTRPLHPTPAPAAQMLEVPPVNYAALAQNPHPVPEHFYHSLPRAAGAPTRTQRVRSKSSHSAHHVPAPSGGMCVSIPTVPPIPGSKRPRAHSSVRPPGAAAPFNPANPIYVNGLYGGPSNAAVSSLHLPTAYLAPQDASQRPSLATAKSKSKSSATLNTRYRDGAQARHTRLEEVPAMPAPHQAQAGFYAAPRASKSSATLYAEPRSGSKSKSSKSSKRERRPPMPEFGFAGERMASPHPAASQMLVHSLVPVATYKHSGYPAQERVKQPSLFKRMFLGKRST